MLAEKINRLRNRKEENMKKILTLSALALFLLSVLTVYDYAETTDDILNKMIEAQGGRKVLEGIKDSTYSGSMEMIMMGLSGSATMYQKEPNMMRMDAEVMGMTFTQAYDGSIAWMTNPQTGATEEVPENAAEYVKREAMGFSAILDPEKFGITFAFQGKEKIGEKEYLVMEQAFADGYKMTHYIDSETYLTFKTKALSLNQMGVEVENETFPSDYKKVEGVMVPQTITIYQDGEEYMNITLTDISFNSGLEDSFFKMTE